MLYVNDIWKDIAYGHTTAYFKDLNMSITTNAARTEKEMKVFIVGSNTPAITIPKPTPHSEFKFLTNEELLKYVLKALEERKKDIDALVSIIKQNI